MSRASTDAASTLASRIALIDNTAPTPPTHPPDSEPQSYRALGDGKREILRKAIAERKYREWRMDPSASAEEEEEGVVVVCDSSDEGEGEDGVGDSDNPRRRKVQLQKQKKTAEVAEIDVLYENQRGSFICGIPLFSSKSLLNFDPSAWQDGLFHDSAVSIVDAQLPDPSWVWDWKSWYVDMTADVDEEGWAYSFSFSPAFSWHGNHVWFHSFVRRRRWLRKRIKLPLPPEAVAAGHRLTSDYFTIHSRAPQKRRSVLEGGSSDWGGGESEYHDTVEIRDVATLMTLAKRARLDREKIEAVMQFVEYAGDEVAYLTEKIPALMGLMVFQASRRQLLAHLLDYTQQYEAGRSPTIGVLGPPPSPIQTSETWPVSKPPEEEAATIIKGKDPDEDSEAARMWKIEHLKRAADAADEEVRKMEYWSDVKGAMRKGDDETMFGGGGSGVDIKGKGKAR